MTRGIQRSSRTPRECADLLLQASEHFEKDGVHKTAEKALTMALMFGHKAMTVEEIEAVTGRCVEYCDRKGSVLAKAQCYAMTKNVFRWMGDTANSSRYATVEDSLDVEAYGARLARLQSDLAAFEEMIENSDRKEKKRLKMEIARVQAEIVAEQQKA